MRIFLFAFLILVAMEARICLADSIIAPLVKAQQGPVVGIKQTSLHGREFYSYLGIPFAEPPIGNNRFKDPVPISPWTSTFEATRYPPNCLQNDFFDLAVEDKSTLESVGVEDCLYLNVHTSKPNDLEAKHPVMVFIHGGGFVCGSSDLYQPYILLSEEVILVTIQYRLGIFGFMSTEDSVVPGNMGLKDQQLALRWVHENILSFGGDPERITIFGESAGGASVHFQMLSPGSKGLFQRAIIQSGNSFCPWATATGHRKFAIKAGSQFGCTMEDGTEAFLQCMQHADAHKLLQLATGAAEWGFAPLYTLPRVDGEFITDHPEVLVKEGRYNKLDVMTGITRDEGSINMLMFHINPLMLERLHQEFERYGPLSLYLQNEPNNVKMAKKIYDFYLKGKSLTSKTKYDDDLMELYSDEFFGVCHDSLIRFLAEDEDISLYVYQFDHYGEFGLVGLFPGFDRNNWVGHTEELNHLFHGGRFFSQKMTRAKDLMVGSIVRSFWFNFARTGNPTPPEYPIRWEKATGNTFKKMSLKLSPELKDYNFRLKRKLWSSLNTKSNKMLGIYQETRKTEL